MALDASGRVNEDTIQIKQHRIAFEVRHERRVARTWAPCLLREDFISPLDQANECCWVGEGSILADQISIQDPTGP